MTINADPNQGPSPDRSSLTGDSLDYDNSITPRRSRRPAIAAVIAAAIVAATVGGFAVVNATSDSSSHAPSRAVDATSPSELRDTTLGELADDLSEFGLHIEITPTDSELDEVPATDSADPFEGLTDAEIDELSDDEYFGRLEAAGIDIDDDFDDFDDFDDEGFATSAPVAGDSIDVSGLDSAVAGQAQEIWGRFVEIIPADQRHMISSFEVSSSEDGGAYVYQDDSDPTKWVLGVSPGLGEDLDSVLIHEFGHLLTLQATEVPPNTGDSDCSTFYTGEGCALSGSIIAEFVQQFWPQSQLDEIDRLEGEEDYDGLDAFYEAHSSDFVSDYAATNPGEDLAETIAVFVLEDRPAGNTIADQKVQMLWDDSDLVALRDQIRANL